MPKDFVERLLNLENSLKTVISICDVTNNERNTKIQKIAIAANSRYPHQNGNRCSENEKVIGKEMQPSSFVKPAMVLGLLPGIKEFDSEPNSNKKRSFRTVEYTPKESDEIESTEFFQYLTHNCNTKNHADNGDDIQYRNQNLSGFRCKFCYKTNLKQCICRGRYGKRIKNVPELNLREENGNKPFMRHIKSNFKDNSVINELARKIEKDEMETNLTVQRVFRTPGHLSSEYRDEIISQSENTKKICAGGTSLKNGRPDTAPAKTSRDEKRPFSHQYEKCNSTNNKTNTEINLKENLCRIPEEQSSDTCETNSKNNAEVGRIASNDYFSSCGEKSIISRKGFVEMEQKKNFSDATDMEITKLIGKNHEKIEKMKRSKLAVLNKFKIMKERYDAIAATKTELSEKMENLIEENEKLMRELKKMETSKEHVAQELENYKKKNMSFLLSSMPCINQEKNQASERVKIIRKEDKGKRLIDKKEEINGDICYEYQVLFRKQEVAYQRLVHGIALLEKVIRNNKVKEKRLSEMKLELKKRTNKAQIYFDRIILEKINLTNLVNKLRVFAEERQSKIEELQHEMKKKEEELGKQKKLLKEKSESLEETSKEMESIRKNSSDMEEQIRTLRKSVEKFDKMQQNLLEEKETFQETVRRIQYENNKLQEEITNEKDSILIKNKIIQDQQETIKELREKSDEVKTLMRKVESLERLINMERGENLQLQESVERLRRKKDELKQKVKSLEADLLLAPQEVVRNLQKTQIVLHELENQVQLKQKEWEILLQSLVREKEEACNFAAFATKKLMETTTDFERQSESHKKFYNILTENVIKKKCHFQPFTEKIKQSVRFSEDVDQKFDLSGQEIDEERENSEMHRYLNRLGIPRNDREWFPKNQILPGCYYSGIKFNEDEGTQIENDYLRHCGS